MRGSAIGTLVTRLVVTCALATVVTPTFAAGESRTVDIPGGLTVTLSTDWRIWSSTSDGDPAVIATDVRTRRTCHFDLVASARTADDAAHEALERFESHRQLEVVDHERLSLPAGHAVRVSYRVKSGPVGDRFVFHEYFVTGPDGVAAVVCQGVEPHDRWLSVVESLEVSTPGARQAPPFDPRVEIPQPGLAVDFGAHWLVRDWTGPGVVIGGPRDSELGLSEEATTVLRAVTTGEGQRNAECLIEDVTAVPSLPGVDAPTEWQEAFAVSAAADDRRTSVPGVTVVDLGSGRALRADWERWRGTPATAWVFLEDERYAVLLCRAERPPDDRWRSIAETFEFLPSAELPTHPMD